MSASLESLMPDLTAQGAVRSVLAALALFVAVGASGAVGFMALSTIVLALPTGLTNWVVSALCYAAFIGPVYLLHRRYSFRSEAPHRQALPRYMAVQAMALCLATSFSYIAYGVLAVPTLAASALVIVLTSGANFIVLRAWAFARTL